MRIDIFFHFLFFIKSFALTIIIKLQFVIETKYVICGRDTPALNWMDTRSLKK